jgi:hypothetical protein
MKHSDFTIGGTFYCSGRQWRCTDIGTRTIVSICLDGKEVVSGPLGPEGEPTRRTLSRSEAEAEGWFNGPPYAVVETVFDEYIQPSCSFDADGNGQTSYFSDSMAEESVPGPYSEARKILRARRESARATKAASATTELPTDTAEHSDEMHLPK